MTIYQAAIKLTQKAIFEITVEEIERKYDGNIGAAAQTLYENYVKEIMKETGASDKSHNVGTYITFPNCKTVHLIGEDELSD